MKTELYIIIAVLFLLTVIMIWWGVKTFLDIRRRQKEWRQPHHSPPYPSPKERGVITLAIPNYHRKVPRIRLFGERLGGEAVRIRFFSPF